MPQAKPAAQAPAGAEARVTLIYKLVPDDLWAQAREQGVFLGAPVDLQDGFIHFSTADQVRQTAEKYFAEVDALIIFAVEAEPLGPALKWEPARGGALFPHLYGALPLDRIVFAAPVPRGVEGGHRFDELLS